MVPYRQSQVGTPYVYSNPYNVNLGNLENEGSIIVDLAPMLRRSVRTPKPLSRNGFD